MAEDRVAPGILAFFIEDAKDNKLQAWLKRYHFGTYAVKYPDASAHIHQYKLALAG